MTSVPPTQSSRRILAQTLNAVAARSSGREQDPGPHVKPVLNWLRESSGAGLPRERYINSSPSTKCAERKLVRFGLNSRIFSNHLPSI